MFFALFLCTGIVAFSQSAAPTPRTPDRLEQIPPVPAQPIGDLSKLPSGSQTTNAALPGAAIVPSPNTARRSDNAKIDPKMIVHPPQSSIGVQPPGTPIAQSEYPNLRMLPIGSSSVNAPPTQGNMAQLMAIPVKRPKCRWGGSKCVTQTIGKSADK
jgi:hypothetical protein